MRGERHDGHDFVQDALDRGAVAAVVSRARVASLSDAVLAVPLLITEDPLLALQALAAHARRRWGKRVVAITGSAGKTTTKEAVAAALAAKLNVMKSAAISTTVSACPSNCCALSQSTTSPLSRWA